MRKDQTPRYIHFLKEIEQAIQAANREELGHRLRPISKKTIMPLAVSVAKLRGNYLAEAFRLANDDEGEALNEAEIKELRRQRELYEEGRLAFEALTHAIDRGYVELSD